MEKNDLTFKELQDNSSEKEEEKKIKAFTEIFFGNKTLCSEFNKLIEISQQQSGDDLSIFSSEFFRWLIQNHRGIDEYAKSLILLHKQHQHTKMYKIWKVIGIILGFPVRDM